MTHPVDQSGIPCQRRIHAEYPSYGSQTAGARNHPHTVALYDAAYLFQGQKNAIQEYHDIRILPCEEVREILQIQRQRESRSRRADRDARSGCRKISGVRRAIG